MYFVITESVFKTGLHGIANEILAVIYLLIRSLIVGLQVKGGTRKKTGALIIWRRYEGWIITEGIIIHPSLSWKRVLILKFKKG